MKPSRLLVVDPPGVPHLEMPPAQRAHLTSLFPEWRIADGLTPANLREAEIILLAGGKFDPADAPKLKWVQYLSAGIGGLNGSALAASGIPVASASGAYSTTVAEMALALLLALLRRLPDCLDRQHHSQWQGGPDYFFGRSCRGRTAGIVGYGSIGREVARLLQAFGTRILACKRRPEIRRDDHFHLPGTGDPEGVIPAAWYDFAEFGPMLRQCDFLIVTLPGTAATAKLLTRERLAALPPHALVINVGRGAAIDEPGLVDLLNSRTIAGAGLDVFAQEPLPASSPLWQMPNVVLSPHIGSCTYDQGELAGEVLIENMRRYSAGLPLANLVDFAAGY